MPMTLGIFARTFTRPTVEENLDAAVRYGLHMIQFNMSCAGLPTLPDSIEPSLIARICTQAAMRGITISAVSGTYNMIHPDLSLRKANLQRFRVLAAACKGIGSSIITLCTGTRDTTDMWRWHPDNTSGRAWTDLCSAMGGALQIAEDEDITLAFEPEQANVIHSAFQARLLLDTMRSARLKVIIDPVNLFTPGSTQNVSDILERAFAILGSDIIMAHAKDRLPDGTVTAAGMGVLDFDLYLRLLRSINFTGPLILHGLDEAQVPAAVCFLSAKLHA